MAGRAISSYNPEYIQNTDMGGVFMDKQIQKVDMTNVAVEKVWVDINRQIMERLESTHHNLTYCTYSVSLHKSLIKGITAKIKQHYIYRKLSFKKEKHTKLVQLLLEW